MFLEPLVDEPYTEEPHTNEPHDEPYTSEIYNNEPSNNEPKPKLIAVCGNIGSGKSTFIKNFLKNNPEY